MLRKSECRDYPDVEAGKGAKAAKREARREWLDQNRQEPRLELERQLKDAAACRFRALEGDGTS